MNFLFQTLNGPFSSLNRLKSFAPEKEVALTNSSSNSLTVRGLLDTFVFKWAMRCQREVNSCLSRGLDLKLA